MQSRMARVVGWVGLLGMVFVLSASEAAAQASPQDAAPTTTAIVGVSVVDVEKGAPAPDQTVVVRGGLVARVGPRAEVAVPDGAAVIPGDGLYLMPGLVDAHVHYIDPDSFGPLMIAHGVVLVRDMGGFMDQMLELRSRLNRGAVLGPEMVAVGPILDGTPPVWPFSEPCETPDQGREAVRRVAARGVDQIKLYSLLKKDVLLAILDEARAVGLPAVGHVPESVLVEEAAAAGQKSAEHLIGFEKTIGNLLGEPVELGSRQMSKNGQYWVRLPEVDRAKLRATLEQVRDAGMAQCPTLVIFGGMARMADPAAKDDPMLAYVPQMLRGFWDSVPYRDTLGAWPLKEVAAQTQALVGEMHKVGMTLMCGTDLANPYVIAGHSLHEEMALFQGAGIPPADVLRCATVVPATFCGRGDRLGTVAEGKTASLLLLRANPLEDVRNARQIEGVFLRGRYFDRAALDAMLARVKEQVRASAPVEEAAVPSEQLPGEVIRRGRYVSMFQQWESGTEDFVITRDEDGYHLSVHNQPMGGPQAPFKLVLHVTPDWELRRAEYTELTQANVEATYTLEADAFKATATQGGQPQEPQQLPKPADPLFGTMATASEMFVLRAAGLEAGQSKTFRLVSFGFPTWQMTVSDYKITRGEDVPFTPPGGEQIQARSYATELQTPMGTFTSEVVTDQDCFVLKTKLTMPFGTVETHLE